MSKKQRQGESPQDAHPAPKLAEQRGIISRRSLVIGFGCTAALFGLGAAKLYPVSPIIRPPGGQNEAKVIASCIHCEKCYEICPRNIIAPGHIEDGLLNIRTPTLNFKHNYCDWCEQENGGVPLCASICPTDALVVPVEPGIFSRPIGKAELNKAWCLAFRMMGCAVCYMACPYEAMGLDELGRPYVIDEKCIGCGACQAACVSMKSGSLSEGVTERAIVVRALDADGNIVSRRGHRS
ncbi:MAG: 4Fe-4S dicluster domain-containing protein [Coriobacteriaceae bacterium]|nr:4Fe-4S dicluster domain-containing protein [Coriobacteriaceae bacterium]